MRRVERLGIVAAAVFVAFVPVPLDASLRNTRGVIAGALVLVVGLAFLGARRAPLATLVVGGACSLAAAAVAVSGDAPSLWVVTMPALLALGAERWSGGGAFAFAAAAAAFLAAMYAVTGESGPALALFATTGFACGTALRLRRITAEALAAKARELEEESALFADLSVRHERARIASELHDIVAHAISVMVVQAAAGQRLLDRDPQAAAKAFGVIARSAEQGRTDLLRLVALLEGDDDTRSVDLTLIDDLVRAAAASGFDVTCRVEATSPVGAAAAQLAFRVVQEGLTNALRHAPGASVRVRVGGREGLCIFVENDAAQADVAPHIAGTGNGLRGVRERVEALGGRCDYGATPAGGWRVHARLPAGRAPEAGVHDVGRAAETGA